jgi:hypothetical protein
MSKDFNHEIKCLADLENRYANIHCHGSYGVNPEVMMLTRTSTIYQGFIKQVDTRLIDRNGENGEPTFEKTLIIESEYGREIKLPYEKIINMTILSSKEQAEIERYLLNKERWQNEIIRYKEMLANKELKHDGSMEFLNDMISATELVLEKGEALIKQGIETYKRK